MTVRRIIHLLLVVATLMNFVAMPSMAYCGDEHAERVALSAETDAPSSDCDEPAGGCDEPAGGCDCGDCFSCLHVPAGALLPGAPRVIGYAIDTPFLVSPPATYADFYPSLAIEPPIG